MLRALRSGIFHRLAAVFALSAALCFALPPAVLAFGHGSSTAHCLSQADAVNHGMTLADNHQDHKQQTPASDHKSTCCGLFCLSALTASEQALDPSFVSSAPFPTRKPNSAPGLFARLDRPPIPSLSV